MAEIRTKPPLDGSGGEIYQGHGAIGKDQQRQTEEQQAMPDHVQHPQQHTTIFQEAGRASRLPIERQGFADGGGGRVSRELIDIIIGCTTDDIASNGQLGVLARLMSE